MSDAYGRVLDKMLGMSGELSQVEQILGRALHYPRYCDDQENFPGTTDADGVCTGDHAPATIAMEAARRIDRLEKFIMSTIGIAEDDPEILGKILRGI